VKAKTVAKVKVKSKMKRAAQAKPSGVSRDYVLDLLVSTINRCRQAEPVRVRGVVVPGEYQFDVANALRATEMLGRHLKMFTDKVEHNGKVTLESLVLGGDGAGRKGREGKRGEQD
jgi:phage terminase small subunit